MRKTLALLAVLFIQLSFGYSQSAQITEDISNQRLVKVFRTLEKKYGLRIGYDVKLIGNRRVTIKLKGASPKEAFRLLLNETGLDFTISGGNYVAVFPGKKEAVMKPPKRKEYTFQGWVLDEENTESITFAKIKILGTNKGVYTDENGKFVIKSSSKKSVLEVSALGYSKRLINSDEFKKNKGLKIGLTVDVKDFPEVVVEYLAEGMTVSRDISVLDIRPMRLGATSGTVDPDVFINLQNVPGINSANGTVSEMQIRGGTSDQNLILWEGITLYHSGHFNGMISSINPYIVDKAKVHRGVYDPYYGGRASGLIELSSLSKIPSKIECGAGVNMISADAYLRMPITKKVGVMLSARRSFVGAIKTPTYKKYANRIYQGTEIRQTGEIYDESFTDSLVTEQEIQNIFHFTDVNGKVVVEPNAKSRISTSLMYTNNELIYESIHPLDSITERNDFLTKNLGASINWSQEWNKRWSSNVTLALSDYSYLYLEEYLDSAEGFNYEGSIFKSNRIQTVGWRWSNRWKINEDNSVNFGYQGDYYNVDFGLTETEDSLEIYSDSDTTVSVINALHANYEWKNTSWLLRLGTRLSHLSENQSFYLAPRLYAQYAPNKVATVKMGAAVQNQFISQVEDLDQAQLGLSNRIWVLSDQDEVPVVQSLNLNAGFFLRWKGWHFEMDGYAKRIQGISNFADDKSMSSGFDRGSADVLGLDFLLKKRWKGWRTWLSYTLSEVYYIFEQDGIEAFPAPFNQPHVVKAISSLSWRNWDASVTFKVASGKPYTKLLGLIANPDGEPGGELDDDYLLNYADLNDAELPIYHRLDVSLFYTVKSKASAHPWRLKFGLSLLNVYDRLNYLSRTYRLEITEDEDGDEQVETLTIDRYYLRFTPNATIRFEFGQ